MKTEHFIARAEIAYKSGHIKSAVRWAKRAIEECDRCETESALKIFIARCYSKLGKYHESNVIYRRLIDGQNYLPPVIMGLLYNNIKIAEKAKRTVAWLKLYYSC